MSRNLHLLFAILIVPFILNAQSISKLDEKNGFKEFKFGAQVGSYKDLVKRGGIFSHYNDEYSPLFDGYLDLSLTTYQKKIDDLKIGDLTISSPTLYFFNNKLLRIDFHAVDWNGEELIKLYKSLYGSPKIINEKNALGSDITNYLWKGSKVSLTVTYCKNPYRGSFSSDDKKEGKSYIIRYLSIPQLAAKNSIDSKVKTKVNQNRAGDL